MPACSHFPRVHPAATRCARLVRAGAAAPHTGPSISALPPCCSLLLAVLVEVNCETDFVARGEKFRELVNDMAMQVGVARSARAVHAMHAGHGCWLGVSGSWPFLG